jgi:hypothetical protein
MTSRRFPPPWRVEQIPGGFKVLDAVAFMSRTRFLLGSLARREQHAFASCYTCE